MRTALEKVRDAPQSTKARILATAEQVFAARGFAGASTREIASQAGVNISSLHYHWESKETLYRAVFEGIYQRILELARSTIPEDLGDRRIDRTAVEHSMEVLFDFFADNPDVAKLLLRRYIENEAEPADIESEVLVPAWKIFDGWIEERGGKSVAGLDVPLFMLTMYIVSMSLVLDSRQATMLIDGRIDDAATRDRVRRFVTGLAPTLLGMRARRSV